MKRIDLLFIVILMTTLCTYGQSGDRYAVKDNLPVFYRDIINQLSFPLSWEKWSEAHPGESFEKWREEARANVLQCMMARPASADYDIKILASEQRKGYTAYLIEHNLSIYSRVRSYLLVPDKKHKKDKFPAVVMLHDHGAKFDIGKEKLVRPIKDSSNNATLESATAWVNKNYDSTFVADYYAEKGFVVFVTDALFWGERGVYKTNPPQTKREIYDMQQALAANMEQMGMSWSAMITYDDIASAELVSNLPCVDTSSIFAVGFSMGAYRAWMLAALSDKIAGGAAVCWMSTLESLISPEGNQAKGGSSFSMTLPGIRNFMDYPDVASIACPKPMLFFNGRQDHLFPIEGVNTAYDKMKKVWLSQNAPENLTLKTWPTPHFFSREMQNEILEWIKLNLTHR